MESKLDPIDAAEPKVYRHRMVDPHAADLPPVSIADRLGFADGYAESARKHFANAARACRAGLDRDGLSEVQNAREELLQSTRDLQEALAIATRTMALLGSMGSEQAVLDQAVRMLDGDWGAASSPADVHRILDEVLGD